MYLAMWCILVLVSDLTPEKNVLAIENRRASQHFLPGPGHLLWAFPGVDDVECVAPFWDVDGDGVNDVLAESFDAGASGVAHFFCLSGSSGDTVWAVWPTGGVSNSGGWGDQCVTAAPDLNGDGLGDALLGTAWGGRTVFAISGREGATLWSYDTYQDSIASGWVYSVAPLPDVDGDSIYEVLAGTGTYCQTVFCFSGATGAILWRFYADDAIGSVCSIRDVNGDGYADAVAGAWGNSRDRHVYCISGNSRGNQPLVLWSYLAAGDVYCVRSIPDVNHSGVDDVVASTWGNYVYCLEGSTGQLIWSTNIGNYGMRIELLADINDDSVPEVIVGSWNPAVIVLDGRSGTQLWRTSVGDDVWTVYFIGDVNSDGIPDVVGGSGDGNVYCFSGRDGRIIWNYPTGGWINSVRSIADVNGDMQDDVITGNQYRESPGYVYCIEGDSVVLAVNDLESSIKMTIERGQGTIYDLTGRRANKLHPGVYFMISREKGRIIQQKLLVRQ